MRFLRGVDPKVHARITAEVKRLEKDLTPDEIFDLAVQFDNEFKMHLVHRNRP